MGVPHVPKYYHHEDVFMGGKLDDIRNNIRLGLKAKGARSAFTRQRSANAQAILSSHTPVTEKVTSISRKRSSSSLNIRTPKPKRSCSTSPTKVSRNQGSQNRIHRRVIMRGYGKGLHQASSLTAMLGALEDNITGQYICISMLPQWLTLIGHQSLVEHDILHRDVSIGNTMIREDEKGGLLIDLDLAIDIGREEPSGAPNKTGTRPFMSIGQLYGFPHSFMDDIESFFWVLFWICVHYNGPSEKSRRTEFEYWNYAPLSRLGRDKAGLVGNEMIFSKTIKENFTPYYQPLAICVDKLRQVIFPGLKHSLKEDMGLYTKVKSVLREGRDSLAIKSD
jgi:Fungal protein kinase